MKKLLSLIVALVVLGTVSTIVLAGRNHDDVPGKECENGEHTNNPHCNPSGTISVTPTTTLSPTPTCSLVLDGEFQVCAEVTPTDTPEPTLPVCGDGEHLNLQGDKCLRFELGGAPSSDEQGTPFKMKGEDDVHGAMK